MMRLTEIESRYTAYAGATAGRFCFSDGDGEIAVSFGVAGDLPIEDMCRIARDIAGGSLPDGSLDCPVLFWKRILRR